MPSWTFTATLWSQDGPASWHFVTVPAEVSDEIREITDGNRASGFGSVRVSVTLLETRWSTSVFPAARDGCYVLPVRKDIRRTHDLEEADQIEVSLELATG